MQVLSDLGLTHSQARVYYALSRSGLSKVQTISKISDVRREHVYGILLQLQDLGLVEKVIGYPSMFRALPIQDGFSLLFQCKVRKDRELQEQMMEIIRDYQKNDLEVLSQTEGNQFVLIPPKKAAIRKRKKEIEAAQTSIDCLVSFNRFGPTAFVYHQVIKEALERGVKIRLITQKPENENEIPVIIQDLTKNPSHRLRYILKHPSAMVTVYDRKEMLVTKSAKTGLGESPALWSNNSSLLAIINDFYEILWITAMETSNYRTE